MPQFIVVVLISMLVSGCNTNDDSKPDTPPPKDRAGSSGLPAEAVDVKGKGTNCRLSTRTRKQLEGSLSDLNAAVAFASPDGQGAPVQVGAIEPLFARSTMKVPLLVALIEEVGDVNSLSQAQLAWASAALEDSNNVAAAELYSSLGSLDPDPSNAITRVLRQADDLTTTVPASIPPGLPSSFISTYGATEWSMTNQVLFLKALEDGTYGEDARSLVLRLMRNVSAEGGGDWGFGALYPDVPFKPGWGDNPDGTYLARQIGFLPAFLQTSVPFSVAAISSSQEGAYSSVTSALEDARRAFEETC